MYKIFLFINIFHRKGLQSKLSPVGEDTNRGSSPWAVSPPPTISLAMGPYFSKPKRCHWFSFY